MIMVEFAGNPGIGKTTLCEKAMALLEREGHSVRNIFRSELSMSRLQRKLFVSSYQKASFLRGLTAELEGYAGKYAENNAEKWGREIRKTAYKLHKADGKKEILFTDEGPAQFLTSIVHMEELGDEFAGLIDEMNRVIYGYPVILFDIQAPAESNIERMQQRNREKDRFLHSEDMDLGTMLEIKRKNLDYAASHLRFAEWHVIINDDADRAAREIAEKTRAFAESR